MAENKYRQQVVKIYQHIMAKNPSMGITVALIQTAPETLKTVIFNIYGERVYYMPGALLEVCCSNPDSPASLCSGEDGGMQGVGRKAGSESRETRRVDAHTFFFQSLAVQCESIHFTL